MKATIILKNLSEEFFYETLALFDNKTKWNYINKLKPDLSHCISIKIGNGSFSDRVDLNSIFKSPHTIRFKIESRKGYRLATFNFNLIPYEDRKYFL